jgi:hypothetical protein
MVENQWSMNREAEIQDFVTHRLVSVKDLQDLYHFCIFEFFDCLSSSKGLQWAYMWFMCLVGVPSGRNSPRFGELLSLYHEGR